MSKARGGSTAAKVIKIILLVLAVIIILSAAVFGAYYLSNGFGGNYATFATTINGKLVLSSGSVELPRGSKIKIVSFSNYTLKVVAAEPEEDFAIIFGDESINYSDLVGEDMTAGFTFTESDGVITVDYGSLDEILSSALGEEVETADAAGGELFSLMITSGKSELHLDFSLTEYNIILDPDHVIF